jgi:hypothetical protein
MQAVLLIGIGAVHSAMAFADEAYPIAGTQPSERPAGAPMIREVRKPEGWFTRALTGVSRPYAPSLKFLEDQGNWDTPFTHPGMPGRYDIRGWHVDSR